MNSPLIFHHVTKRFEKHVALNSIDLEIPEGRIVGLLGRNGAGKSTLLNIACGLVLPTEGSCTTLGRESPQLDTEELSRLGVVHQESRFLDGITVHSLLSFTASYYPKWDKERQKQLTELLEVPVNRLVSQLSPGDQQKVGILLGVCHHPSLLLLDEPVSALDPIARTQMLKFLLTLVREDACTIVISSHILADVEKVVDWVVCLDKGEVRVSSALDDLLEGYSEWTVSASAGLPEQILEAYVLGREGTGHQARLVVREEPGAQAAFASRYAAEVAARPMNLERKR